MDIATGEFVIFVDSDDYIESDLCEKCIKLFSDDIDIVAYRFRRFFDDHIEVAKESGTFKVYSNKEICEKYIERKIISHMVCDKMFRRSLFKDKRFIKGRLAEDLAICYKLIGEARNVVIYDKVFYNYYTRSNSIMGMGSKKLTLDAYQGEIETRDYILENYPTHKSLMSIDDYMEYMGRIDEKIIAIARTENKALDDSIKIKALRQYAKLYSKEDIFIEMVNVCRKKPSKDALLKFIDGPTRFEFLTSIALVQNFNKVGVYPNYVVDDEGIPIRHASGGKADIVCTDAIYEGLVEVTLMIGRQQTNDEILPIARHLTEELQERPNVVAIFVAPIVFEDASRCAGYIKYKDNIDIKTYGINEFIDVLNNYDTLDSLVHSEIKIA